MEDVQNKTTNDQELQRSAKDKAPQGGQGNKYLLITKIVFFLLILQVATAALVVTLTIFLDLTSKGEQPAGTELQKEDAAQKEEGNISGTKQDLAGDAAAWQTYKNSDYYFGFKHPANYAFDENFLAEESVVYSINFGKQLEQEQAGRKSARGFSVAVRTKTGDLQAYLDGFLQSAADSGKEAQELIGREVRPFKARMLQNCKGKEYCDFSYFFADDMFIFEIKHPASEQVEEAEVYEAMVDSFFYYFSSAQNKEVYANKAYGYLLDYPNTWTMRENEHKQSIGQYVRNTAFTSPDGMYTLYFGLKIEDETPIKLSDRTSRGYEQVDYSEPVKFNGEEVVPDYYGSKKSGALKEFVISDYRTNVFIIHAEFLANDNGYAEQHGEEAFAKLDFKDTVEFEQAKQILASFRFSEEKL